MKDLTGMELEELIVLGGEAEELFAAGKMTMKVWQELMSRAEALAGDSGFDLEFIQNYKPTK